MKRVFRPVFSRTGFTLTEMIVVIAVIVLLAGVGIQVGSHLSRSQDIARAKTQLALLEGGLEQYQAKAGLFPEHLVADGSNGTPKLHQALFSDPVILAQLDPDNDRQNWLLEGQGNQVRIADPWGNEYHYRSGSDSTGRYSANPGFDLWSCGPDGETRAGPDGDYDPTDPVNRDDVRSW
ncbi:MAG: type II secretion system protein GspG [Verrucomicrobiota bacterium]